MAIWRKGGINLALVVVALIGGLVTSASISGWFNTRVRPAGAAPNWVIGPVWDVRFVLMAVALYLTWTAPDGPKKKRAMQLHLGQLVLNGAWSCAFFALQSLLAGAVVIVILWIFILLTILSFRKISRPAAWMLVPYIIWVTIAGSVNYGFLALNGPRFKDANLSYS